MFLNYNYNKYCFYNLNFDAEIFFFFFVINFFTLPKPADKQTLKKEIHLFYKEADVWKQANFS